MRNKTLFFIKLKDWKERHVCESVFGVLQH